MTDDSLKGQNEASVEESNAQDSIGIDSGDDDQSSTSGSTESIAEVIKEFYSLEERLRDPKFNAPLVKTMIGKDISISFMQKDGFENPLYVIERSNLELRVPTSKEFGVSEIRAAVGSRRCVEAFDSISKKIFSMTMKDWNRYFDGKDRSRILNVLNLEFSNTKLDTAVSSPKIVRQIDWIDKAWPRHLKDLQIEPTSCVEEMMYPKVQKYCIMSVKRCFTDFHIDAGGSSAWYYVHQGKKVFWLIPPTDENLKKFEDWALSGKQNETFFADQVTHCARHEISAGNTFFIPSGWIHAVYTVEDSILFGGQFLHSFAIEKQLQVSHIEDVTHCPKRIRFPFFTEMLWYVLDRYVHCMVGRSHLDLPEDEKRRVRLEKGENIDPNQEILKIGGEGSHEIVIPKDHVNMTQAELHGIKYIVMFLHGLSSSKKRVPVMLPDPIAVIKDVKNLVISHKDDCPDLAVTGKYILRWSENDDIRRYRKHINKLPMDSINKKKLVDIGSTTNRKLSAKNRRRRVRCKTCEACLGGDCRACVYCQDMTKYGGPGRMKQTCEKRRCLHPQLPVCAYCSVCKLDGWYNEPKQVQSKESDHPEKPPDLFECTVCLDIVHPKCVENNIGLGKVNEDLSNSWECAKCASSNYNTVSNTPNTGLVKKREREEDEQNNENAPKVQKVS